MHHSDDPLHVGLGQARVPITLRGGWPASLPSYLPALERKSPEIQSPSRGGRPCAVGPAARDALVVIVSWGFAKLGRTATNDTSEADLESATVEFHITCQRALQPLLSAKWVKLHVQKQNCWPVVRLMGEQRGWRSGLQH
jgi:hypothetical protein